ncbi:MAG: peptidoglycan-binding protein [Caulobacterales bacterium]
MAEDLARQSGLTLSEWLAGMMSEEGPEDATSQEFFSQGGHAETPRRPAPARFEAPGHPADEVERVTQALERLSDRIETAESRQALAISGIERSVREVISRLDGAEREQMQVAARFEGAVQEVQTEHARLSEHVRRVELEMQGPRSADAVRALEGALGKVASHVYDGERRSRDAILEIASRVDRLDQAEQRTTEAVRDLQSSCSALDGRLAGVEGGTSEGIEQVASNLSARVEAAREELAERLTSTAEARFDRVEQALAEMTEHVRAAEQRSASVIERMGREVLEVAQTLNRRVQSVEHRATESDARVSGEVARIATAVETRLVRADSVQAAALEKLGAEIARITERLADRIASAERRSAQAIDEVGEQVARVTERMGQRHDRSVTDLADRIRQSEDRTAKLLEEARQKIDESLGETQRRLVEAQKPPPAPAAAFDDADDALFADEPFPTYNAPTMAERGPIRPSAATAYAPVLRQSWPEPPTFAEEDFAAADLIRTSDETAAAHEEPATLEMEPSAEAEAALDAAPFEAAPTLEAEPALEAAQAIEEPAEVTALFEPVDRAPLTAELAATELATLEPNVGFDMDDEAAQPEASRLDLDSMWAVAPDEADAQAHAALETEPTAHADERAETAAHDIFEPMFEPEAAAEPETTLEGDEHADPLSITTRDVIERARAAARATSERDRLWAIEHPAAAPGGGASDSNVLQGLAFGRPRKRPSALSNALMVASLLAAVTLSAGGFLVLESKPVGSLPKPVNDMIALIRGQNDAKTAGAAATPMAAIALSPKPIMAGAATPFAPDMATLYATAAGKVTAGAPGALADLQRLADQGYAPAQFFLSKLYEDGKSGLKKDPVQARNWAERAAQGGDRGAMHNLGLYYFQGVGGARDTASAAEWFRRAAELGLLDSQFNLAGLYEHGEGVSQNSAEAYKWYLIAAHAGDPEARAGALRVRSDLTAEARAVAERAAAAFSPAPPPASTATAAVAPVSSPDLVTAQWALSQLGYYQGPTDGVASPALRLAISAYQRDQGMASTGAPDSATIGKLQVYTR